MVRLGRCALLVMGVWLLAVAGCSSSSSATRPATPAISPSVTNAGEAVSLQVGGGRVSGRIVGHTAREGVLLMPDAGHDATVWASLAEELSRTGYLVLVLDSAGSDPAATATAAQAFLRGRGAEKIALAGEGAVALVLPRAAQAGVVAAVVALSPLDGDTTAPRDVAALFMASLGDAAGSATARRLYDAASEPRSLALVGGDARGAALLDAAEPRRVFLDFLQRAFTPLAA